jgi:dTDP-4-dehydrorhamnose 3,5-epimerase
MNKHPTSIADCWILEPKVLGDERGFFLESWNSRTFAALGLGLSMVQDNHSQSKRFTLRGLHYQAGAAAQDKLVWVTSGEVFDVVVDLRRSSPSFGKWEGIPLSAANARRVWVPKGCAHGFLVLSESADFMYKCSEFYSPAHERCLRWDDPGLAIKWPLPAGATPVVSKKDEEGVSFAECEKSD